MLETRVQKKKKTLFYIYIYNFYNVIRLKKKNDSIKFQLSQVAISNNGRIFG